MRHSSDSPRKSRTSNKRIVGTIIGVAAAALVLLVTPFVVQRLAFIPRPLDQARVQPSYWGLPKATLLRLQSGSDAVLAAWWVPHQSNRPLACGTVLVFGGNMGNITDRARTAAGLSSRGVDVMLFDYRGFGASSGHPTETGLNEDAIAAYKAALARTPGGASRLVLFAHSLGSVPAIALASGARVGGIVLLAPYASIRHAVASRSIVLKPLAWLIPDSIYAPARHAAAIRAPVLIASGGRDKFVDRQTTDSLFQSFGEPKWRVHSVLATHNGLLADTMVWRNIDQFLSHVLPCH